MEAQTLNQLFAAACARHNKDDAILHKEGGEWKKLSSAAWLDAARDAAVGLSLRGVAKGDRVVLLSENRLEWFTIEAGLQILGAVTVPIYPTLTAQQAAYIIRDSGARVVIASSAEQQAKIAAVRDSLTSVEMVFTLDAPVEGSGDQSWSRVIDAGKSSRAVDSGAAELWSTVTPGDSSIRSMKSRLLVGSSCTRWLATTTWIEFSVGCTSGTAPVTVIESEAGPTSSSKSTFVVPPTASGTDGRVTV